MVNAIKISFKILLHSTKCDGHAFLHYKNKRSKIMHDRNTLERRRKNFDLDMVHMDHNDKQHKRAAIVIVMFKGGRVQKFHQNHYISLQGGRVN